MFNLIICSFLKIYLGSTIHEGHCSVCNDATLKAVEGVYSNCKLRKMRHQFDFVSPHSLSLVVSHPHPKFTNKCSFSVL